MPEIENIPVFFRFFENNIATPILCRNFASKSVGNEENLAEARTANNLNSQLSPFNTPVQSFFEILIQVLAQLG